MTAHVLRLRFALDPLMAEAKRRARQRRTVVAVAVLLATGLVAGLTFGFRSPDGGSGNGGSLRNGSESHHITALEQQAIVQARTQIPFLRAFPRVPGTAPCVVHPGG